MKLQKILLAVMAVVIAALTVAFYMIPQPLLPQDAVVTEIYRMSVWGYSHEGAERLEDYDVTNMVDAEKISNILQKYTRSRWSSENGSYQLGEGQIDLLLITEQQGAVVHLDIALGGNEIGGKEHDVNYVNVHTNGEFRIHNADELRNELTALLSE